MSDTPQLDTYAHAKANEMYKTGYKTGYPWTTQEARAGNLRVIGNYKDGFKLKNTRTGHTAMWFKRKYDAVAKIHALRTCPNTPQNQSGAA